MGLFLDKFSLRKVYSFCNTFIVLEKYYFTVYEFSPQEMNSPFRGKSSSRCFCWFPARHVDAHPDGYQRGVFLQSSINLGKSFL